MQKVKVLWPPDIEDNPIVPTTASIEAWTDALTCGSDPLMAMAMNEDDIVDGVQNAQEGQNAQQAMWALQSAISKISAEPCSYHQACQKLRLDLMATVVPGTPPDIEKPPTLFAWQVQALKWLQRMKESKLCGWLLVDEMGLGKTITALSNIQAYSICNGHKTSSDTLMLSTDNKRAELAPAQSASPDDEDPNDSQSDSEDDVEQKLSKTSAMNQSILDSISTLLQCIQKRTYRPTLILAPSAAIRVWKEEVKKTFKGLMMKYYYSLKMAANLWDKDMTLGTHITNLVQYVDSLPNDPSTLRVIVLSSYSTWQNRSLYWDTNSHIPTRKKPHSKHDDFGSDHEENLTNNQLQILHSFVPSIFKRVCTDEAQKLKGHRTQAFTAVQLLDANIVNLMTATPMLNRPTDLLGLLILLWQEDFHGDHSCYLDLDEYKTAKAIIENCMLSVDNINDNLWLLDPEAYSFHIKPEKGEDMTRLVSANAVLPPLLSLLQLCRTMASTIEDVPGIGLLQISANIPPIQWKTVELGMFQ